VAQFMVVLDLAIVNVALPSIQKDLHVTQDSLQWILIAYGLMLGGFLLLGGRMADLLGRRRILVLGLVIFTAASLLAGLAGSPGLLIAARAAQGFGAAMLPPTALATIAVTFTDGQERFKALGIYGATGGISATVGVVASGLITDGPGWRWVFLINVPIGLLLIAMAANYLPADHLERTGDKPRFDVAGAVTVTGGLLALVYGLNRGADKGWANGGTIGLFVAAAVLLAAFIVVERQSKSPLVPGEALKNPMLVAANFSAFFTFGAFIAFIFIHTLMMQQILGYSPTKTGVAWLATTLVSFVVAGITGTKLAATVGVKKLLIVGQALLAIAYFMLTRVPQDASYLKDMLPWMALAGMGGGFAAPAVQIGALSGVPEHMAGLASGFVETLREVGGAVGIALVTTVLVSRSSHGALAAFHASFWVIAIIAALGAVSAAVAFPSKMPQGPAAEQAPAAPVAVADGGA
jgi:EmrB/QacA subfamily drug resistance transporter